MHADATGAGAVFVSVPMDNSGYMTQCAAIVYIKYGKNAVVVKVVSNHLA